MHEAVLVVEGGNFLHGIVTAFDLIDWTPTLSKLKENPDGGTRKTEKSSIRKYGHSLLRKEIILSNNVIPGIHHVTAIAGYPQQNIDFYTQILGLHLVKLTVNYDDPGTYHLYFGDDIGHPGTILTFFPWLGAPAGLKGTGQLTEIGFSVPGHSMKYWKDRLDSFSIKSEGSTRFGSEVISFTDPDGIGLELIASDDDDRKGWIEGPVLRENVIKGFHSVTLTEEGFERTSDLLVKTMGFTKKAGDGSRYRFETGRGRPGSIVDVLVEPSRIPGVVSVGTVHHVAFRTPTDEEQRVWREKIANDTDLNVTPIIDRKYFHSIYFREPGGVLFEIATDPPGFTIDEPVDRLGSELRLPPRLEPLRMKLEQHLPPVTVPKRKSAH